MDESLSVGLYNYRILDVKSLNRICKKIENAISVFNIYPYFENTTNVLNVDNRNTQNYTVETSVKEMYTKGNTIALNLGTEVEFINTGGWLLKRYVASQEVSNVTISDNIAGIIYRDKVEIINL